MSVDSIQKVSPADSFLEMFTLVFIVPGTRTPLPPCYYISSVVSLSLHLRQEILDLCFSFPKEVLYEKNYDFKLIICFIFFIVQLQLSAFCPHPSIIISFKMEFKELRQNSNSSFGPDVGHMLE